MKLISIIHLIALFLSLGQQAFCQQDVFYSNALVYVNSNALIHVNGNILVDGSSGVLANEGDINARTSINQADMAFLDNSQIQGSGNYRLQGDWINSASFECDSSHVFLDGDNQLITGDSISTFHVLELDSSGVKTQTLDAYVNERLVLNHLELATETNTMFVLNSDLNAVENTTVLNQEGMVSSLANGKLFRSMNTTGQYLFPLGSSLNVRRYRPLFLTLSAPMPNDFAARLVNNNAANDGYDVFSHDSTLCLVNDLFYHEIDHVSGMENATVEMHYLPQEDGVYDEMVQWDTPINALWNKLNANTNVLNPFSSVVKQSWSNFTVLPFALGKIRPQGPVVQGSGVICDSTQDYSYVIVGNTSHNTYLWSTSTNGSINSGQDSLATNVSWGGSGNAFISAISIDTMGCSSYATNFDVDLAHIEAEFDTVIGALFGEVTAVNNSIGASDYQWQFGDEYESIEDNPTYIFNDAGMHEIVLTAYNDFGCEDTASIWVEVLPGVNVPNVFTPNGDGENDLFSISAVGMVSQELYIFNRWGQELYYIDGADINWDGTIPQSGRDVPEGTYFYLYKASSLTKEFEYNGALLLVR